MLIFDTKPAVKVLNGWQADKVIDVLGTFSAPRTLHASLSFRPTQIRSGVVRAFNEVPHAKAELKMILLHESLICNDSFFTQEVSS